MSTERGSNARSRPQKHQNRFAFKNDLHDKTPQMKKLNSLHVCEVCEHCKAVIEWKIKYKKYKALSKPKTCIRCQNRNVKKAYHVLCRDCATKEKVCAKCLKSGEEVTIEPPAPTGDEQVKLKVEMEKLIKSLPERKRRTFLRYMAKGKDKDSELDPAEKESAEGDVEENKSDSVKETTKIPRTREDLLKKIDELKLGEDESDDCDFDSDFSCSDESCSD